MIDRRHRRPLPPLNALRTFEAAARLGSLTAASDELCVTHGAVSLQIRALEDWAGAAVFERQGRRLRLTEAGRAFRDAIGPAFAIAEAADRLRRSTRAVRVLTVDALPTFAMRWLLPRLSDFQQRRPEIALRLVTSDLAIERLAAAGCDIAIRRGGGPWPAGWSGGAFLSEREIPVCAPALAARLPIATPADLAGHTLLAAETRPGAWDRWLQAAGVGRVAAQARMQQFGHFYLALQAAIDGLGVALGPLPILEDDLASGRLIAPLAGPAVPSRPYCWLIPQRAAEDPDVSAFRDWLVESGRIEPS